MGVRVFISYRHSDSRHLAGRLRDRLADAFGEDNVFFDVESIAFGMDFRAVIRSTLQSVDVVLALVGPDFSPQRLSHPNDIVRLELTTAFDLGVPVIPVLVESATMPAPDSLPDDLERFAYLHAARLRADPDFRPDVTRLIDAVRQIAADRRPDEAPAPGPPEPPKPPGHTGGWAPIPWMPEPPDRTDPATGRRPRVLVDQPGPTVATLAFSPDGALLAGGGDQQVHLWAPAAGRHLWTVTTDGTTSDLAFAPRHRLLAVATSDHLRYLDPADGQPARWPLPPLEHLHAIAFSPDGKFLAASDRDTLTVWHQPSDALDHGLGWTAGGAGALAFSPAGQLLAGAGADGATHLWDPVTGVRRHSLAGHGRAVHSVVFSPDGRWLASAGDDGTIGLWDPAAGRLLRSIRASRQPVRRVAFSPGGRLLASAATSGTVRLWHPGTGEKVAELSGHSVAVRDVAFSPDGALLATCGGARHGLSRSEVFLWDLGGPS